MTGNPCRKSPSAAIVVGKQELIIPASRRPTLDCRKTVDDEQMRFRCD